jgi:segregation and condensation protein B
MLDNLEQIIEAILLTSGEPVSLERLKEILGDPDMTSTSLRESIVHLAQRYENRGVEIVEVASGYRFQARREYTTWLEKMHARKSSRYSKAFLETLALIIYRQPLTRGEIEEIRGVAVSTQIIKTLLELEWIRIVGQRDVPGKPSLYATTSKFLDDFNLKSLSELPPLQEPKNLEQMEQQLTGQLQLEMVTV